MRARPTPADGRGYVREFSIIKANNKGKYTIVACSKRRADGLDAGAVAGNCGRDIPNEKRSRAAPSRMAPTRYTRPAMPMTVGKRLTGIRAAEYARIRHSVDFPSDATTGNMRISPRA